MNLTHWPPGLPRHLHLPQTSVYRNLEIAALRYPDRPALIYYGREISYAQFAAEVDALAGFLQQRCNVRRGDRVALYLQNSVQFVIAFYAVLRADAAVVPVNTMNLHDEVRHVVQDSGAKVAIFGQELQAQITPLLGNALDHGIVAAYSDYVGDPADAPDVTREPASDCAGATRWKDALDAALQPQPHQSGPDDLALLPYTSGTTGLPKGCRHTHRSVMHTAVAGAEWVRMAKDAVSLAALPMFHVTGLQNGVNTPVWLGSTMVVMTRWDRACAARLIERHRITAWTAIPTMLFDFLAQPDLAERDVSSLNLLTGGGAAMPKAIALKIRALWGIDYNEGYGLSETMAPTHVNPVHRPKPQCLGLPIQDTEARVVDVDSGAKLPVGEVGEILVRGPQVFAGYHGNDAATAEAFVEMDGLRWFRTGDLGYVDDEGYFFMVDRLKRMINASGFKVWPAEVEAMLFAHPDIQEACVIGTRDAHRGESVKALVVARAGATLDADAVIRWAREHMAAYKVPHRIELVERLPKGATGKVLWRQLQEAEYADTAAATA
jgi:fatty-acyl-CoA synthase